MIYILQGTFSVIAVFWLLIARVSLAALLGRSPPSVIRADKESAGTISHTLEPRHNEKLVRLIANFENSSAAEYSWLLADLHGRLSWFPVECDHIGCNPLNLLSMRVLRRSVYSGSVLAYYSSAALLE